MDSGSGMNVSGVKLEWEIRFCSRLKKKKKFTPLLNPKFNRFSALNWTGPIIL